MNTWHSLDKKRFASPPERLVSDSLFFLERFLFDETEPDKNKKDQKSSCDSQKIEASPYGDPHASSYP